MKLHIRPVCDRDVPALVELTLQTFVPIFASFESILGPAIYRLIWPDWRASQKAAVESMCRDAGKITVLVAEWDGTVAGFLAYQLNVEEGVGEVQFLAVHPAYQDRGIGTALNTIALAELKKKGMKMAKVETGGDGSHAPARRCYEKAGYVGLPLVRYFKDL